MENYVGRMMQGIFFLLLFLVVFQYILTLTPRKKTKPKATPPVNAALPFQSSMTDLGNLNTNGKK